MSVGMALYLIDGTYELFRAHFGAPSSTSEGDREVGATRGLLRSLGYLLTEPEVTHVGCAFDHVIESFRNRMFAGYKTGEGIEPELLSQFPLAEAASKALGMITWPMVEFEADDAIATAAGRFVTDAEQVVICSPDKDMAQCVIGDTVIMLDRMRKKSMNETGVVEKFGVSPASIPDYLALVGDSADGIPGIPKWGAKGSSTLLAAYGHLDAIPSDPSQWSVKVRGAAGLSENLEARREDALLYRTLATLRRDVPLEEDWEAMRYRGPREDDLRALGRDIGEDVDSLLRRLDQAN